MNVRCPACQSVFRVDPARVPATGIRAKCSRCGKPFVLRPPASRVAAEPAPGLAPQAPAAGEPPQEPAPQEQPAPPAAAERPPTPAAMPPEAPRAPTEPPPSARIQPQAPAAAGEPRVPTASPRPAATVQGGIPVFGSKDPDARARRIARALVSDIVAYNRQKVDRALAAGNMRTEFREEIMKSWEEYAAQVGAERARHTPHFRDALNEILAQGQRVF